MLSVVLLFFRKVKNLFIDRLSLKLSNFRLNKRLRLKAGLVGAAIILFFAYTVSGSWNTPADSTASAEKGSLASSNEGLLNSLVKTRAEKIISSFENSTTNINYAYAQNINDGRGITAGRSGFTSGTGDLLMVVRLYEKNTKNQSNALAKYLAPLVSVNKTGSTKGLEGFEKIWAETSRTDAALNRAQDKIYDTLYFNPALAQANKLGLRSAVGQLIILDTIIQQGEGNDNDGLPEIISETNSATLRHKAGEAAWLNTFLNIRQHHLENAADPNTAKAWKESVSRVYALRSILKSGNLALKSPLNWSVYGDTYTLKT